MSGRCANRINDLLRSAIIVRANCLLDLQFYHLVRFVLCIYFLKKKKNYFQYYKRQLRVFVELTMTLFIRIF